MFCLTAVMENIPSRVGEPKGDSGGDLATAFTSSPSLLVLLSSEWHERRGSPPVADRSDTPRSHPAIISTNCWHLTLNNSSTLLVNRVGQYARISWSAWLILPCKISDWIPASKGQFSVATVVHPNKQQWPTLSVLDGLWVLFQQLRCVGSKDLCSSTVSTVYKVPQHQPVKERRERGGRENGEGKREEEKEEE